MSLWMFSTKVDVDTVWTTGFLNQKYTITMHIQYINSYLQLRFK